MNTENLVTSWKLDATEFQKGVDRIVGASANVKAKLDMAIGAAQKLGAAFNEIADRGAKFANLQKNNTLSIEAAKVATRGLVSEMDLLKASNSAVAFDLGLTSEQFAKMSSAAVVMSQKLGTDANQAIGDLILGMSRQSKVILDNLGLMVSAKDANAAYADQLGKAASQLTDAEKKTAFMNATMKELDRLTSDASLGAGNLGDKWAATKNTIKDTFDKMSAGIVTSSKFNLFIGEATDVVHTWGVALGIANTHLERLVANMNLAPVSMGHFGLSGDLAKKAGYARIDKMFGTGFLTRPGTVSRKGGKVAKSGRSRGRGSGVGGGGAFDVSPGSVEQTRGVGDVLEEMMAETQARATQISATADLKREIDRKTQAEKEAAKASAKHNLELSRQENLAKKLNAEYIDLAVNGLAGFASGMWSAADAAIMGSESFGMAMAKMLKDTLLSIATQSTVKAIFETAEGFAALATYRPVEATQHFTAAGIYGAVALTAGAAGLATSAAIGAGGGYSSGSSSGSSGAGSSRDYSSSFSGTKSTKSQPINVNLYLGDPGDPSAALMLQKQLKVQMAKAA